MANDTKITDLSEGTVEVPVAWLGRMLDFLADANPYIETNFRREDNMGRDFLRDVTKLLVLAGQNRAAFEEKLRLMRLTQEQGGECFVVEFTLKTELPAAFNSPNPVAEAYALMLANWTRIKPHIAVEDAQYYTDGGNGGYGEYHGNVLDIPDELRAWED